MNPVYDMILWKITDDNLTIFVKNRVLQGYESENYLKNQSINQTVLRFPYINRNGPYSSKIIKAYNYNPPLQNYLELFGAIYTFYENHPDILTGLGNEIIYQTHSDIEEDRIEIVHLNSLEAYIYSIIKYKLGTNDDLEAIKFLISLGANVHYDNDVFLRTAEEKGYVDITNYLRSLP